MGLLKEWGSAMYWMRKRASDGEDSGIDESMDLENGVHLEMKVLLSRGYAEWR